MSNISPYNKEPTEDIRVRKSVDGPLEGRDPETGAVVWRQKKKPLDRNGRVRSFVQFQFSENIAEKILAHLWEGEFISNICDEEGFPTRDTVRKWTVSYPDFGARFREAMDIGRKVRAEASAMKILEIANQDVIGKDDAPGERLKADLHMWNAEVSDPENYGKRTKITGDSNAPLKFVISTGFPEPNKFQTPPELGEDGLIKKLPEPKGET